MKKILIIDDEEEFCFLVKDTLEATGNYKVVVATDGKNGMRAALDHNPQLILLDIIMPVIDGFEVLRMLKEDDRTVYIPVIMLTALSDEDSKTKAASLYNEDYIIKPVDMGLLKSKVQTLLG